MTDRMPSIADHRDEPTPVSPLEFSALQHAAQELEGRVKRLEALMLSSDPPPSDEGIDVTVSREKGVRLRGRASAVVALLTLLGVLAALTYGAVKWGPPAHWQRASEGAGGR
jgi:hypothetical protein